jgi:hypothetical protein
MFPSKDNKCIFWVDHEVPGRGKCKKYKGQVVQSHDCDKCKDKITKK